MIHVLHRYLAIPVRYSAGANGAVPNRVFFRNPVSRPAGANWALLTLFCRLRYPVRRLTGANGAVLTGTTGNLQSRTLCQVIWSEQILFTRAAGSFQHWTQRYTFRMNWSALRSGPVLGGFLRGVNVRPVSLPATLHEDFRSKLRPVSREYGPPKDGSGHGKRCLTRG